MDNQTTPIILNDIISRKNEDGTVVLMKTDDSDLFYKIEGVAAMIWEELEDGKELESIKSEIQNKYQISSEQINSDVTNFFSDLKKFKLID